MKNETEERFPLDDAAVQTIQELRETVKTAQTSMQAVVAYFCRQNKIQGRVSLADNGKELIIAPVEDYQSYKRERDQAEAQRNGEDPTEERQRLEETRRSR